MISWHVLNIGCITRNKFWGEDNSKAHRNAVCTSVLINCSGKKIIVDPSLPPEEMNALLDTRCGLKTTDIDMVYVTHAHGDHYRGIEAFKNANWFMAPLEYELQISHHTLDPVLDKIKPAEKELIEGIAVLNLPGHTEGLAGLEFRSAEGVVVIAGDSVMTRDFFMNRLDYYNCVDAVKSKQTIDLIAGRANIVVPGHDNYFINTGADILQTGV